VSTAATRACAFGSLAGSTPSASTSPGLTLGAASAAGTGSAIRSTAPGGERVQRATQSMKRIRGSVSAGAGSSAASGRSLASGTVPSAGPCQTAPGTVRPPSGTVTRVPGSGIAQPSGTA
jgi:hypothetical protein